MFKKRFIPLLTLIIVFSCFKKSEGLKQSEMQILISRVLMDHAYYNTIDDTISRKIYSNLINSLDPGKYYFYQSDIDSFSKHEMLFDDYIISDDYTVLYDIFSVYKKRTVEAMKLFDEILARDYDFSINENIVVERDKVPFASSTEDMSERWRKNIKLQLLNYTSSGKSIDEAKSKLKKKYELTQKRIDEIDEGRLLGIFMNAFTTALDPHSNYLTIDEHEDFEISMKLKLQGIGVRLRSEDGFVIVESIITGGAADKLPEDLQLIPNDKIMAVAQKEGEFVDVIDMDLRDVVKLIRGKKGTTVRLNILRESAAGPERMVVPIVREEIQLQDSEASSQVKEYSRNNKKYKVGYIKLPSFYEDAEKNKSSFGDVSRLLSEIEKDKADVVVLDLRGNPGGLLSESIRIAGLFIEEGPVVQIKNKNNPPRIYYADEEQMHYTGPLVVLIDRFSASAAEILAGAIRDYRRGVIIGPGNTFGKGTVQSYQVLPRRLGAIKTTTHIFYQPDGTSNQLWGIAPDVVVPDMSSIWKIGESETRFPLKWEKIRKPDYKVYKYITPNIADKLNSLSRSRTRTGEYIKLREQIEKYSKRMQDRTISLKEESDINRQREKEMEEKIKQNREKDKIDLENDLFLREVFNLTADYLEMIK